MKPDSPRDWTERFDRDLDRILDESGRAAVDRLPPGYDDALDLARELAGADFSDASRNRGRFRRRLTEGGIGAGGPFGALARRIGRALAPWRRTFVTAGVLAVALMAFAIVRPGSISDAGARFEAVFGGAAPTPAAQMVQVAQPTEYVEGGPVIFGGDRTSAVAMGAIRQPDYLPVGYAVRDVVVNPSGPVVTVIVGPGAEMVLVQSPRIEAGGTHGVIAIPAQPIEGLPGPAEWTADGVLVWEAGESQYTLGGGGLSRDEAVQVAMSLR
jgi:hypothetical protein